MASDPALLRWPATVVRHRSNVTDQTKIETNRLKRAHCRFSARAWPFDEDLDFFQTMAHRLPSGILCHELRRVGRALARTLESDLAGARPPDHVSGLIGNGDNGVVERRVNMRNTAVNILRAFCFDDLWGLDRIRIE